ncbi:Receptor-like protein 13 [Citrus sinensis]|nr:Receptor-like protein 13 [Citrus sinensis]
MLPILYIISQVATDNFFFLIMILELGWWSEGCLEQERYALLKLKHDFFNNHKHLQDWILMVLGNWEMKRGYLNASLFTSFQQLELLDLSSNRIAGCIENEERLSSLSSFKFLDLSFNSFNNKLDSLSNLEELDMSFNEIENLLVPKDYISLKNLHYLHLSGLRIRDGSTVLHSMGSFPSLETLSLQSNNFKETSHNFTNLEELTLDSSFLYISLLQNIASFTSLKTLSMDFCEFNGVLPRDRGKLIVVNDFSILNFKNLEYFNMDFCTAFSNSFLQMSELMASLKYLSLSSLCELVHLQEVYIDRNNLSGSLSWCLANLKNISSSPLMNLTSIEELWLSNNHFQIPISLEPFFNHPKIKIFDGDIYAEIETSHSSLTPKFQLTSISLFGHGDSGIFPKFLYHQHDLEYVDLSHLNLTREFPNWLLEKTQN